MSVRKAIATSLGLISPRDRKRLIIVAVVQMATALLDLVGILLLGVVTSLAVARLSSAPAPSAVADVLIRLGISNPSAPGVAVALAVSAGLLLILKSIINIVLTQRVLRFLANRQAVVAGDLARRLLSQPLLQIESRSSQDTGYALTSGVNAATLIVLGQGVVAVTESALLVVLAIGLLAISPVVTLFTVAFFATVALLLQRLLSDWAGRLGTRSMRADVASFSLIQEAIRTYREVVVSNRRAWYAQRFEGLRWEASSVQSGIQFIGLIPKYVFEIALVLGAGLLAASQLLTRDVESALGVIAVFLLAGSRIVPSMLRLQAAAMSVKSAAGQAESTYELAAELKAPAGNRSWETQPSSAAVSSSPGTRSDHEDFVPRITVTGVWLTYPGSPTPALVDVNLDLPPGASLALVGPTGAGKSTLADVILGVLDPDRGGVRIGGLSPLDAISRWPGGLAYVPQEVSMANGTVRENVALGLPLEAIDDGLVWEALGRAHLADFLREKRDGLDTIIGESGVKLSGGQRQRLGIARALYTRPRVVALDEATSALDAETEQAISATLRELEGVVTTVTVAHRLATIRHCDLVLYLEGGRIVASGSFDDVRRSSEHFDQQARLLGL